MNGLDKRQAAVLKNSKEWYWRAMLTRRRFVLVPCLYLWRVAMLSLVGFLALPAAILIGIVCMICCFIEESHDAFVSLVGNRYHRALSFHSVSLKILRGVGKGEEEKPKDNGAG